MKRQTKLIITYASLFSLFFLVCGCLSPELKELDPCLVSSVSSQVKIDSIENVDLLFVIDKSESMLEEQEKIGKQFKRMIRILTSGDKDPDDNAGVPEIGRDFLPVKSLHLGVVSSDLGLPGIADPEDYPYLSGCSGTGDDAWMLHERYG